MFFGDIDYVRMKTYDNIFTSLLRPTIKSYSNSMFVKT